MRGDDLPLEWLTNVPRADERVDVRRKRRSLTETELVRPLEFTCSRPLSDRVKINRGLRKGEPTANVREATRKKCERLGRERALIYKTLVLTGLRRGELASLTVGQLELDGEYPIIVLRAADEKNREGSEIPVRSDLSDDLRAWIGEKLAIRQDEARSRGEGVPDRLPADTPLFAVPDKLVKILNRDLQAAGIPKKDDRGRTVDVHAMRHTFISLLSKGGVAPRTAQAAARHGDMKLTMQTYTDPRVLDVFGALDVLPALPLERCGNVTSALATSGFGISARSELALGFPQRLPRSGSNCPILAV